jgi:integrase
MAARTLHKLTPDLVKRRAKKPGLYGDGGGLYLRVTPPAAASWVFRYMLQGKAREMGLGSYPAISLHVARERAREARTLKASGKDPIQARNDQLASERRAAARGVTFAECVTAYLAAHRESWRNAKHRAQWQATLEQYANPIMGAVPVSEVDRAMVIRVLEPIWPTKNETASRLRGRIEAVLDWATARDYRSGDNPARWKGSLAKVFPARSKARKVQHHPALPYRELPSFMAKLKGEEGVAAEALQFTILTAARTGEVIGATWDEIDVERAMWTVPASRTKTSREHRVPLSKGAVTLLKVRRKATGGDGFVFPGARAQNPLSDMAMLALLRRMGRDDLTVHGFRSTFRDWSEEMTNFAGSVAEAALGHVVGDKVEAAYRRGDLFEKRRALMTAWAKFCSDPNATASADVVPIRGEANAG